MCFLTPSEERKTGLSQVVPKSEIKIINTNYHEDGQLLLRAVALLCLTLSGKFQHREGNLENHTEKEKVVEAET